MVTISERYLLRMIDPENTEEVERAANMDKLCYDNPCAACTREEVLERIDAAPEIFLVAVDRQSGELAGIMNGVATDDDEEFLDEFFSEARRLHDPDGSTVMLCGLDVMPEHRGQGLAKELVRRYCEIEKERGRKRLLLTCVEEKIDMYRRMGFRLVGVSSSVYGGTVWYDMDMILNENV